MALNILKPNLKKQGMCFRTKNTRKSVSKRCYIIKLLASDLRSYDIKGNQFSVSPSFLSVKWMTCFPRVRLLLTDFPNQRLEFTLSSKEQFLVLSTIVKKTTQKSYWLSWLESIFLLKLPVDSFIHWRSHVPPVTPWQCPWRTGVT